MEKCAPNLQHFANNLRLITIAKDRVKDEKLTEAAFEILRFNDDEVLEQMEM